MNWSLYLDDVRECPYPDCEVARSYQEAVDMIEERGLPMFLSFDHDLGESIMTGMSLAVWIKEKVLNKELTIPKGFEFKVHSANPVGATNINRLMLNLVLHWQSGELDQLEDCPWLYTDEPKEE